MVARFREIRTDADIWEAGEALLALMRIERPTDDQRVGALLLGEFVLKVNQFLPLK